MKDELSQLFNERFTGHESPVDPGLWDAIKGHLDSQQLVSSEEGLKDLLQDKFSGHEVPVDPAVWSGISQQLGHGVAVGGAGVGAFSWIAAAIGAVVIAGATYFYFDQDAAPLEATPPIAEMPERSPSPIAPSITMEPSTEPPAEIPAERVEQEASVSSSAPATVAGSAPEVIIPEPSPREPLPSSTVAGTDGAEIVATIIAELTTRVTAEVLAEAAQRSTLSNTPPAQIPDQAVSELESVPVRELPKLFLPNTFTPNDDGVNDTYTVFDAHQFERVLMRVYDVRNDRLVFSTNTNEPWTGAGCLDGYYLVAVEALTPEGELVTQGKVVWLNRNTMH